jgi:hypothetical protein
MAVISKGIKLYKDNTELTNLQEIPELGGDVEAIEITTLADAAHMYTDGLLNYGDSLAFKFLYEAEQFHSLKMIDEAIPNWKVELPDGTACAFTGTHSVKLDGVGVGAALTYTLNIKPNSEMEWTNMVGV